jgi:hypothetical protein
MKPGNLEVHWPEGNVLIDRRRRSPQAGIPDYNAVVRVEKRRTGATLRDPAREMTGA